MNEREAALKALYEIEFNGAYSNIALKNILSQCREMSRQSKAMTTALVYGVTDKKLTLDYYISSFSKIKLKKISKYILIILRMGIYQLIYMDKVPQSAAVNESVKLAKRYGHSASAGFVNGILRNVSKNSVEFPKAPNEYLSVKYSYPIWLCDKWIADFGFDFTEELMIAFEKNKKITLRPNTLKTTANEVSELLLKSGIETEIYNGMIISDGFDIEHNPLYADGYFTPQDIAAAETAKILEPHRGELVIDMCCAPGGKRTHIAELMGNEGKILAFDKYEHKIEIVKKNAERLGIDIIDVKTADACELNETLINSADRVLCDVPCSGLGIIGRKPDIKWNREETSDIEEIQKKILEHGAKYLKCGGVIVYSTCTIDKSENEAVTDAFIADNCDFVKDFEKTYYPNVDNTDGFYICKLRKKND